LNGLPTRIDLRISSGSAKNVSGNLARKRAMFSAVKSARISTSLVNRGSPNAVLAHEPPIA